MKSFALAAFLPVLAHTAGAADYIWPSGIDEIEDVVFLQQGYAARFFSETVTPCGEGGDGEQHAATWLRTAFHDMIGHDAAAGSGGLDASIWFEIDREGNRHRDFNDTFIDFRPFYSLQFSAADLLALGVVVMHSACGGTTKIPFRHGRVDATGAANFQLPQPWESTQSLLDKFATAGLNQEEMIALTACGHSLGGVHQPGEDGIDPGEEGEPGDEDEDHEEEDHEEDEAHEGEEEPDHVEEPHMDFDTTPQALDNRLAVEYMDGTTVSPLVVGENATTNSDLRIFSSDGNVTMAELASSQETFESRCSALFSKMIDSVPGSVTLSEPVEAIDVKPYVSLSLDSANQFIISGRVRIRTTPGAGVTDDPNSLSVAIKYATRAGVWQDTPIDASYIDDAFGIYGETFAWYDFEDLLSNQGISEFRIETTNAATGAATTYDNQGTGYPVQDSIVLERDSSCVSETVVNGKRSLTVTATVHKSRINEPVMLHFVRPEARPGTVVPRLRTEIVEMHKSTVTKGDYHEYRAPLELASNLWRTTFDIVQGGADPVKVGFLRTEMCVETDD